MSIPKVRFSRWRWMAPAFIGFSLGLPCPAAQPIEPAAVSADASSADTRHAPFRQAIASIMALLDSGQQAQALELAESTWKAAEAALGDRDAVALDVLHHYALATMESGEHSRALALNERAFAGRRDLLGATAGPTLDSALQLSAALGMVGRFREAEARAVEVYRARVAILGEAHPDTARALFEVAPMRLRLGRLDEALVAYRAAFQTLQAAGARTDPDMVPLAFNYVHALMLANQVEEGQRVGEAGLKNCLQLHGEFHENCLVMLNNLAALYETAGKRQQALPLYARAAEVAQRILRPGHPTALKLQVNYRYVRAMDGDPHDLELLQDLVQRTHAELGDRHMMSFAADHSLANALAAQGFTARAASLFEQAAQGRSDLLGPDHPETLMSLTGWAQALWQLGEREPAKAKLREVVARQERARELLGLQGASGQRDWQAGSAATALFLVEALLADGEVGPAFDLADRLKARQLMERHRARKVRLEAVLPDAEAAALTAAHDRVQDLDSLLTREADGGRRAALQSQRIEAASVLTELLAKARASHPRFAALVMPRESARTDGRAIGPGELYLSFLMLEGQRLAVFTLDAAGRPGAWVSPVLPGLVDMVEAASMWYRSPLHRGRRVLDERSRPVHFMRWSDDKGGFRWRLTRGATCSEQQTHDQAGFEQRVQMFRRIGLARRTASGSHVPGPDCSPATAQSMEGMPGRRLLARELIELMPRALRQRIETSTALLISPDGPFWTLPWDAVLREAGVRVPDKIVVTHNLATAAHLRMLAARPARPLHMLAVGDAAYPDHRAGGIQRGPRSPRAPLGPIPTRNDSVAAPPAPRWPRLPYTRMETEAAARLFGPANVKRLEGVAATAAQVTRLSAQGQLASFTHLLFSVHGYFDPDLPGGSGLVLAPDAVDGDRPSYLSAADLGVLSLDSRLVILSACDTAKGQYAAGEGQMGLSYALQLAGNQQTIATLWPIPDRTASQFVTELLAQLRSGASPAAALSQAKNRFRRSGRPEWSDPSLWGAFVLHGS